MAADLFEASIGTRDVPVSVDLSVLDWRGGMLVRSTNWLGDAVMTLPGVFKLRELLPDGVLFSVLTTEKLRAFWECVPWVDRIIPFQGRRLDSDAQAKVRDLAPGMTAVLPNSFGAAWDLWRAGLPNRFGRKGRGRGALLHHTLPEYRRQKGKDRWHQARHYLEMAAACGATSWDCSFPSLEAEVEASRAAELVPEGPPLLVLAPGAAYGPAKQWPPERFREVAMWWANDVGTVVSTGAPNEQAIAGAVIEGIPGARNLAGTTSLTDLVYVLGKARCVVANDSGTMHLAAAMKRDGVAVFGSTDPVPTGPVGGRWFVEREVLSCSPCLKRECERDDVPYECLNLIAADRVKTSVQWLLKDEA